MDVTADNLLNQVSTIILDKIDKQNIDPNFLKEFMNTLLKKFTYKDTSPIKQPKTTTQTSNLSGGIVEDVKKIYKQLLKTFSNYKQNFKDTTQTLLEPYPVAQNLKDNSKATTQFPINPPISQEQTSPFNLKTIGNLIPQNILSFLKTSFTNIFSKKQNYNEGRTDLIKEKEIPQLVLLEGITKNGHEDFKKLLKEILKELPGKKEEKKEKESKGLFDQLGGIATFLSRSLPAITSALTRVAPLLLKVAGPIAAIAGGEIIGGQIGKMIGSNETVSNLLYGSPTAGKEAYEKYGTGITGLFRASYAAYEQGKEAKQQQEEHQQMSQERIKKSAEPLSEKTKYNAEREVKLQKIVDELREREKKFKEQYEELKSQALEGWNPFADEQKETEARMNWEGVQESLIIAQNKLAEFRKLKTESTKSTKPPIPLKEGGLVTKPTIASIAEPGNPEFVIPLDKMFDMSGANLNNSSLEQIAGNTKDTNKALNALADAIIRMVGAFNQKAAIQGGTTIVNAGDSRDNTSASMASNFNLDPIRRVRSQFAV